VTDREDAWDAVHEALPAGWRVAPVTYSPAIPGYSVSALSGGYSRTKRPHTVQGTGDTENAALRALDDRLRGVPQPNGSEMEARERRIRLAYSEGAAECPTSFDGQEFVFEFAAPGGHTGR